MDNILAQLMGKSGRRFIFYDRFLPGIQKFCAVGVIWQQV
jgi:hypothetical protein